MSPVFRLALGLAAVDGLASAFVATLMLAFFVIGSGERSAAVDFTSTEVLLIKKSVASEPMQLQLLVDLQIERSSSGTIIVPAPESTGLSSVSGASGLTKGGAVYWLDCRSERNTCESQLVVTKANREKCWHVRLSVANTPQSFADTFPRSIGIEAKLMPDDNAVPGHMLPVDGHSWIELRVHCGPQPLRVDGS